MGSAIDPALNAENGSGHPGYPYEASEFAEKLDSGNSGVAAGGENDYN
jgi:hypothetical protein